MQTLKVDLGERSYPIYIGEGLLDQPELLAPQKLQMDAEHSFDSLAALGPVTHVRFNIFPDGGVSRLRLFGKVAGA